MTDSSQKTLKVVLKGTRRLVSQKEDMFCCPSCQEKKLEIGATVELQPGSRWDEEALQLISCENCQSTGLAIYRESRRGAIDSETVEHEGAFLPLPELLQIRATLLLCPNPSKAKCGCAAHKELRNVADALLLRPLFPLKF
jgi:hypothetical protein